MSKSLFTLFAAIGITVVLAANPFTASSVQQESNPAPVLTDSNYVVLPCDMLWNRNVFKHGTATTLDSTEIQQVDSILAIMFSENGRELQYLTVYKFQLVPAITESGRKEVWVNALCTTFFGDWRKRTYIVMDGGNCFFNLYIDLNKKMYYDLTINGEA